ncbi:MAG TPA: acyl-CoA dehydrogenase family protein [Baekduia sp.]|uniref:acyl-CoA dehydrogenase family protein n=1 Tax=Baekduia sp. TaxID=2600305 RepID=UPI002D045028|nr:acyl-CoA dehydrogenase family protein [Baekduia sp.]HMJ36694.1 acyl-CoA dehydrogenase family protein [Baekduia sp.]
MSSVEGLSDERRALVEAVRDFARRECGTRAQRDRVTADGADTHSPEVYAKLASLGWLGATIPEAYGGAGGTVVDGCLLLEELEYGLVPVFAIGVTLITAATVQKFGTEEQRAGVLGSVVAGRPKAIAMSEPGSGSDVGSLRTSAVRGDGGWILNGQKTWITGAHHADEILVVCRTDSGAPKHGGISMFLVPADAAGVEIRGIPTMAGRESNDVFLADVRVGDDAVVGTVGEGWSQLMAGLNFERLVGAAWMLGVARRAFDETLEYVRGRHQFGRPVGSFQALKHRLADLATELEATRLLIYDVARRAERDPGRSMPREASMAKLKASELARRMALDGMQMMGGAGYAREYEMEHLVRKALPMTIYAGTSEIQREIIGSTYGL